MGKDGVTFDAQGNVLQDQSACAGVRADLKSCLLQSDCVKKNSFSGKTWRSLLGCGVVIDSGKLIEHLPRFGACCFFDSEDGLLNHSPSIHANRKIKHALGGSYVTLPGQGKKTPRECLLIDDGSVPMQCQALRNLFFECKRSMLDQRQRFRGRKGY